MRFDWGDGRGFALMTPDDRFSDFKIGVFLTNKIGNPHGPDFLLELTDERFLKLKKFIDDFRKIEASISGKKLIL